MKSIIIDRWPIPNYIALRTLWYENSTISLITTELSCYDEIVPFLISEGDEFALVVLSDLVEKKNFPSKFLEKVFYTGDLGCQLSVCYSEKVPESLRAECSRLKLSKH
ncbi:hypothetical protein [Neisseria zalophi]|nr:hypothetical protein [Neisseria zalophi]